MLTVHLEGEPPSIHHCFSGYFAIKLSSVECTVHRGSTDRYITLLSRVFFVLFDASLINALPTRPVGFGGWPSRVGLWCLIFPFCLDGLNSAPWDYQSFRYLL